MRRAAQGLLLLVALLPQSGRATAQDVSQDFSTLSVLTMAKDEAERAPNEETRTSLRISVSVSIRKTGNAAAFADYLKLADAARKSNQGVELGADPDVRRKNREITERAEAAFLAGRIEQAKAILKECHVGIERDPPCAPGHLFFFDYDTFLALTFLFWDIHADRLDAALLRLKSAPLSADTFQIFLPIVGTLIAQGDAGRTREIWRLIRLSGLEQDSCLLVRTFSIGDQKPSRAISKPAQMRKLACDGKIESAIEVAMSYKEISLRVQALGIVAEGIAGIPGPSDEQIYLM